MIGKLNIECIDIIDNCNSYKGNPSAGTAFAMNYILNTSHIKNPGKYLVIDSDMFLVNELKTYRYRGHSMSDAQHYRTKEEVAEYQKIDPITQVKDILLENKYATEKQIKEIDKRVKDLVAECEKFAEESPYPDKNVMYDAVYEQEDYPFIQHKI